MNWSLVKARSNRYNGDNFIITISKTYSQANLLNSSHGFKI